MTDFSAVREGAWPNNLPAQFTAFVGRAHEREQALAALTSARLLVLTGAGGAGKTRLAVEVAASAAPSFPDGAWWVELAPLSAAEQVPGALTGVLGVQAMPGRTETQAATARLGTSRSLVVLDNCEHVQEAAADLAEAVLRGCPNVIVLATSRIPLGVPGESDWRVPPLSLPEGGSLEEVARSDAGGLFAERAAKVAPHFTLSAENAAAVASICRDVDGLPLAIELAAARVRMLSPRQIADGLGDCFRLLTGGPRRTLARHQTLRASVDWSYGLLSEPEQRLFQRLAVFSGGWSLEAVEAVCAGDGLPANEILDHLTSLVDRSLAVAEPRGRVVRYHLLETVRQYARELLEHSGELASLGDRHLAFFVELSERAQPELNTTAAHAWLELLDPEAANVASAIDHAVARRPEDGLRIGRALMGWWKVTGRFAFGLDALTRSLAAHDPSPSPLRAQGLAASSFMARLHGDFQTAIATAQQALAMAESVGDQWSQAVALQNLASFRMFRDPLGSRPQFDRGIEIARALGDPWLLGALEANLARAYLFTDDFDQAQGWYDEVATLAATVGLEFVAQASTGLGWCALERGQIESCFRLSQQAVSAAQALGEPFIEALAHFTMARAELLVGQADSALERMTASEQRAFAHGVFPMIPTLRTQKARALVALGRVAEGHELLEVVAAGAADSGWPYGLTLLALADVLRTLGDVDGSQARGREALALADRLGARSQSASANESLARLAIERGGWAEADGLLHDALSLRVEFGAALSAPQTFDALALVAAGREAYIEAARLIGAADRARADLGLARWPPDAPAMADLQQHLRVQLERDAFEVARGEGAAMTVDEAIGWARRARGARRRPTGGWEALTPTELRVVELVAGGLTNRQIAERMFISPGTARIHVQHIFEKLSVHSRSELTALAVRRST